MPLISGANWHALEHALTSGEPYVQDAAPEAEGAENCGCTDACSGTPSALMAPLRDGTSQWLYSGG